MALSGDLQTLLASDLPEGRQNLLDSYTNLERVAEYCENNYFQSENKRAALEETKGYTTQSLASVAYQINTLAYNFLQMLDLQTSQLSEMASQVNHISQTVDIHKEKVARREIGILTTNKSSSRQYKIIAPANPERPAKYVRKPIDYCILDDIGHGVKQSQTPRQKRTSSTSSSGQYGVLPGNSSASSLVGPAGPGPAPTTKPPTPPQANRMSGGNLSGGVYAPGSSGGTLGRASKDYRTPSVVAPPQLPSNYAPNYPRKSRDYGTLPPQVQMVYPVQQQMMMQQHPHEGGYMSGMGHTATMPRLSSNSMRSTDSHSSSGGEATYGRMAGTLGRQSYVGTAAQASMAALAAAARQDSPQGSMGRQSISSTSSPYGVANTSSRPTQRPPSPPLPPPPPGGNNAPPPVPQQQQQQQFNPLFARQMSTPGSEPNMINYSRQSSLQDAHAIYSRHASVSSMQQQPQPPTGHQVVRQNSQPLVGLARQTSTSSTGSGAQTTTWVPKTYLQKVVAIYDYNADKEDELSFNEGAVIYVLKKNDDGWWEGTMNGITGLFPGNYVEAAV